MREDTRRWIEGDHAHCWHPFTRQAEWCGRGNEPLVLVRGEGSWLWDSEGRRYLDGNSSIWTNVHGHAHPAINAAIQRPTRKNRPHLVSRLHPPARRRTRRPALRVFPGKHTGARVLLRRWLHRRRVRAENGRAIPPANRRTAANRLHRLCKRLPRRHPRRGLARRRRAVFRTLPRHGFSCPTRRLNGGSPQFPHGNTSPASSSSRSSRASTKCARGPPACSQTYGNGAMKPASTSSSTKS